MKVPLLIMSVHLDYRCSFITSLRSDTAHQFRYARAPTTRLSRAAGNDLWPCNIAVELHAGAAHPTCASGRAIARTVPRSSRAGPTPAVPNAWPPPPCIPAKRRRPAAAARQSARGCSWPPPPRTRPGCTRAGATAVAARASVGNRSPSRTPVAHSPWRPPPAWRPSPPCASACRPRPAS